MPSTRARSDGVWKGPALSRKATIRAALLRPIPEIRSRSVTDPLLMTSVNTGAGAVVAECPPADACAFGTGARSRG